MNWISSYTKSLIKLSTPYAVGNGIVLKNEGLLVTHEHLVRDVATVTIEGLELSRRKAEVLFIDEKSDLAFVKIEILGGLELSSHKDNSSDVLSIALCNHNKINSATGILTKYFDNGIIYNTAYLSGDVNGSALFSLQGHFLGINTYLKLNNTTFVKTLSSEKILESLRRYKSHYPEKVIVCSHCDGINIDNKKKARKCQHCDMPIVYFSEMEVFEPRGVELLIERVITELGFDVEISRRGLGKWEIDEGSAQMVVAYQDKSGFVIAEATLAHSPETATLEMYAYLMKQNFFNKGMSFSLKGDAIILSLIIYDQHLHFDTCKKLVGNLIKCADLYDNILIQEFGATSRN